MAIAYKTPGVYIEEIAKFPPSVAPVETAIPAFIGYTEKAIDGVLDLKLKPTRISSLVDYETYFGGPQKETAITVAVTQTKSAGLITFQKAVASLGEGARSKHILYYSLQLYFANGGGPCYIISVGTYKAMASAPVEAELAAGLAAVEKEDEPTLIVIPEAQSLSIGDFKTLQDAALAQCAELMDRFVIMDVHGDDQSLSNPNANLITAIKEFRDNGVGANNLKYGAAYAPNLETTLNFDFEEGSIDVIITTDGAAAAGVKLNTLSATDNAAYELSKAAIIDLPCKLPPSPAMAGIYAAVDSSRGVWKAPANVSVATVVRPVIQFTNIEQDQMNVDPVGGKSVNAVRPFIGQGTLVWGARTLAGNDNEWRYINVRRLFIFIEESVKKSTMQFVFESNDANTWVKVQGMIENFLTTLWRQGALQGVKPEHAFYVSVGLGKTMTALDILEGRMIVEIGLAAVRPAEFIILRFSHKLAVS
ncbi:MULTISPECIES: phage tail sheath C-terminal domain-containing protein [unclassified Rhizobium]|uniref:phage tail sheath family protein n=1 Tax=unclassified Rhizobium TaxID=2613769 RepID=UPI000CDF3527|nr:MULTISPECIES: phage tail sheath C-terminal domain-containing protein [Rhizobium]AVA23121.1 phage tail sheath protein [Rhizobium sp. NXC24]UWU20480.1 phage tail sheath subtilisin-like domain-containing protein [Rhizobium tropici]